MKRRRTTVALLVDRLMSEYAVMLRRSIERAATRNDVSVLVAVGQSVRDKEPAAATQNQIYTLINQESVDGVIIVSAILGHYCGIEGLVQMCRSYAPLPVCSLGVELPGVPSIIIENQGGTRLGVEHLIDVHGSRRIALIAGPQTSVESDLRIEGYRAALEQRGLTVDENLIAHGTFTLPSGRDCMIELMQRGAHFDAVVAANDDMALGAMDVLRESNLRVPRDLLVLGFDDINSAHFARPPLSTLRQPIWWMGESAVESILRQLRGEAVPLVQAGAVELVRRESCGCGYRAATVYQPKGSLRPSVHGIIQERRAEIAQLMRSAVAIPTDALGDWPDLLLNALDQELDGKEGRFNNLFEELLEEAQSEGASLDEFQRVVSVLRAEFQRTSQSEEDGSRLERIWHDARVLVGAASIRLLGRQKIDQQIANSRLGWVGERLATTLSLPLLKKEIFDGLAQLQISRGAVSLHSNERSGQLKTLVIRTDDGELGMEEESFPETELAPRALFATASCQHFVALPITFETEMLGLAVFAGDAQSSVYEQLRQQIGSAIKGAMLHREMVAHVASRAQLEADRLAKEARLAAVIQTSINPVLTEIPGLEVAALMVPAAEAGGDYYDVIATSRGAWIGIGDVTGHGLGAGLIMLMIQSMIAGLTRMQPPPLPSQVVSTVGDALWDSVRLRLKRDDHATLTVMHYQGGGRFAFAGAHEDLIVWRSRTGRCELVPTPGFWVGALPSIRHMTQDSELVLSAGDLLILHTDGITEARNTRHEQFSLERLVRYIEELARQPAAVIRDRIQEAVSSWSASLDDDVTLLVVRYLGEG